MSKTDAITNTADRPLQSALDAALAAAEAAEAAWEACECEPPKGEQCSHLKASYAADAAVVDARDALRDSDEPRDWILREEGCDYSTIEAESVQEALEEARSNVDRANYGDVEGTIWIDVSVRCEETGEEESATVALDEEEPECLADDGEHDWQSPYDILGGLKENPGVWGHGGGVIIREVCMICGCERITDTWAQNPETGEQGLRSVCYEAEKHVEEVTQRRLGREREEVVAILNEYVHDAEECERTPNVFVVAWVDDDDDRDVVEEIRKELPKGWSCSWTGDGNTDGHGTTTSDFRVEPE